MTIGKFVILQVSTQKRAISLSFSRCFTIGYGRSRTARALFFGFVTVGVSDRG
jgi:hypothetical protein